MANNDSELKIINCLRFLAVDAVEKANSGHPGMPMGMAPAAFTLWDKFLRHNPEDPDWPDRDRFVLSAGHGSMLLYGLLHLSGYNLPLDQIKDFRQWGSLTPGHPEYGETPGVETTTGPLGQGFSNAVGMALAEAHLAARFNRGDLNIVDHFTYSIAGDGCLMEGVTQEAASLAGHLGLGKLIVLYDNNHITIDGSTDLAFTEDVLKRFEAYGWHVQAIYDGNDTAGIARLIQNAREESARPSLISIRTHIAYGAPTLQDSASSHGSPLGEEEVRGAKENLGWPTDETFHIPPEAEGFREKSIDQGRAWKQAWFELFERYEGEFPDMAAQFQDAIARRLPKDWDRKLPRFEKSMATRKASGEIIQRITPDIPHIMGGSADLTPSNNTYIKSSQDLTRGDKTGRNIRFGVREHAMGAVINGMTLHKGMIAYGGTFLVFSDYMRPAVRLAALMKIPSIFIFTHDSIGLGEDGPTHQPVEHLAALRAIPGLTVIRPADPFETSAAWKFALEHKDGPVALVLTRQSVPLIELDPKVILTGSQKGAYIVHHEKSAPADLVVIGTGSELSIAIDAARRLEKEDHSVRVVSLPSWEIFENQDDEYRQTILPAEIPRMSVEAQVTFGWERWTGSPDNCYGINRFGASAPGNIAMAKFGFVPELVAARGREIIGNIK